MKCLTCERTYVRVQVSLAIRGGYVSAKFQNANTKTGILGLI